MGRTTDEWAALLNGTTEGPWEAREDHGGMNLFAGSERVFGSDSCGDVSGADEDVRLAAHAPAAVAEVIRLRRALEEQRDRLRSHAKADSYLAKISTVPLVPFYGDQADLLDRILNGDTDD